MRPAMEFLLAPGATGVSLRSLRRLRWAEHPCFRSRLAMVSRLVSPGLRRVLITAISLGGLSAALSACATADRDNPANLPGAQASQVSEICRSVIGAPPGFTLYSNCVQSLSNSAARADRLGTAPAAARIEASVASDSAQSYFRASSQEIRRREQSACARLGYDPTSGGFAACVASLDTALYAADHRQP